MTSSRPLPLAAALLLASAQLVLADGWAAPKVTSTRPSHVEIAWEPQADATSYALWRRTGVQAEWAQLKQFKPTTTRHVDRSAVARVAYSYKVVAHGPTTLETAPSGQAECLADFYLTLDRTKAGRAAVYVHKWDSAFEEWLRSSDPFWVSVGEEIGAEDMLADFSTGARLEKVWLDAEIVSVKWIAVKPRTGAAFKVSTRDAVPETVEVWVGPQRLSEWELAGGVLFIDGDAEGLVAGDEIRVVYSVAEECL